MGFRFRKSIKLGKHVRINLSKSGIGYSVGGKGLRYTRSASGRKTVTTSIPGTGLSYSTNVGKKKTKRRSTKTSGSSHNNNTRRTVTSVQTSYHPSQTNDGCLWQCIKWTFILMFWPISLIVVLVKLFTSKEETPLPPSSEYNPADTALTPSDVSFPEISGKMQKYREEKENFWDSPILRQHYNLLADEERLYSRVHQSGDYRSSDAYHFEAVCKEDISLAEEFVQLHKKYNQTIPHYPCFKQLAIFYEKQGNYHLAITVCEEAIRLGFEDDGTKGGMTGRIEKLEKKQLNSLC